MPRLPALALLLGLSPLSLSGCDARPEPTREPAPSAAPSARVRAKPEIVAPPAQVAEGRAWVASELARAAADGRRAVIYVGATWCEPCRGFHDALTAGKLDQELADVRFLELDHDAHEHLLSEGDMACASKLVPLFALPTADGRCSDQRHEGAIKGDGAVGFIVPRLKALLR